MRATRFCWIWFPADSRVDRAELLFNECSRHLVATPVESTGLNLMAQLSNAGEAGMVQSHGRSQQALADDAVLPPCATVPERYPGSAQRL